MATTTMSRIRATGSAFMVVLVLALLAPRAHAVITLTFDPPDSTIMESPPDTLTVAFLVDTAADTLKGFSVVLEFDSSLVTPISVAPGPFLGGGGCSPSHFAWLNAGAVGDSLAVDGAALGCPGVSGSGTLFEIQFVGVMGNYGVSPLECRDVRVRNPINMALVYDCVPGTIEKIQGIAVDPATWGRMKALYR